MWVKWKTKKPKQSPQKIPQKKKTKRKGKKKKEKYLFLEWLLIFFLISPQIAKNVLS